MKNSQLSTLNSQLVKERAERAKAFFQDGYNCSQSVFMAYADLFDLDVELLDEYDRNDGIHIVRNRTGITVENLSNILKRNDIKKSEAYQSGFLEGTTPMYDAYMRLKKSMAAALK